MYFRRTRTQVFWRSRPRPLIQSHALTCLILSSSLKERDYSKLCTKRPSPYSLFEQLSATPTLVTNRQLALWSFSLLSTVHSIFEDMGAPSISFGLRWHLPTSLIAAACSCLTPNPEERIDWNNRQSSWSLYSPVKTLISFQNDILLQFIILMFSCTVTGLAHIRFLVTVELQFSTVV